MNRRGFFAALAGVAAVPFVGRAEESQRGDFWAGEGSVPDGTATEDYRERMDRAGLTPKAVQALEERPGHAPRYERIKWVPDTSYGGTDTFEMQELRDGEWVTVAVLPKTATTYRPAAG